MNRHAGPTRGADFPAIPEPTYAERARTLVYLVRSGALATLSRKHAGHPFASVMPYALDAQGQPLVLISSMAIHTQNLQVDPRASLLVTQPVASAPGQEPGDPLAAARLTLLGEARQLSSSDSGTARATYLARHPRASYWVDFDDFSFWRLDVKDVYFDYDKADVRGDQQSSVQADAQFFGQHSNMNFTVEGHCDERGSTEYNLTLGDNRARAVRDALAQMGVNSSQLSVISFGKEKPFCSESNEQCWQQNRRGHFVLGAGSQ